MFPSESRRSYRTMEALDAIDDDMRAHEDFQSTWDISAFPERIHVTASNFHQHHDSEEQDQPNKGEAERSWSFSFQSTCLFSLPVTKINRNNGQREQ